MKTILLILIFFLLLGFCPCAMAAELSLEEQADSLQKGLSPQAEEILEDFSPADGANPESGLKKIGQFIKNNFLSLMADAAGGAGIMAVLGILSQMITAVVPEGTKGKAVETVCILAAGIVVFPTISDFSELTEESLDQMVTFSTALLPVLTAAAAGNGAVTSAAVKYGIAAWSMDVFLNLARTYILPLIRVLFAASFASAVFPNRGLDMVRKLLKSITLAALTLLVLAFVLYLSLTGVIASSGDAAATRITKTVMSSALPVVGGILSDAADAVVSSMGILKNTVGSFGVIGLLAICLVPFLRLSLRFFTLKTVSGFFEGGYGKMISSMADICGLLLGTVSAGSLMVLVSVISLMKVVTGA